MTKASKEETSAKRNSSDAKELKGQIDAKEEEWSQHKDLVNFQNIFIVSSCSLTVKYCKQELLTAEYFQNLSNSV